MHGQKNIKTFKGDCLPPLLPYSEADLVQILIPYYSLCWILFNIILAIVPTLFPSWP